MTVTRYIALPFMRNKFGIGAGQLHEMQSEAEAIKVAESMSLQSQNVGALALKHNSDSTTNGAMVVLRKFGEAPANLDTDLAGAEINRKLLDVIKTAFADGASDSDIQMGLAMFIATAGEDAAGIDHLAKIAKGLHKVRANHEAASSTGGSDGSDVLRGPPVRSH
jgi:hypothetical protein